MENERWCWIKGYEGRYKISDYGKIESYMKRCQYYWKQDKIGKLITPNKDSNGYYQISLRLNNSVKTNKIARLVSQAFIPNPLNKPQVNHKNGVKTNNHYSNLEWVTNSENILHAYKVLGNGGGAGRGESHYAAKLTWEQVKEIRKLYKKGIIIKLLGNKYEVSNTNIRQIVNNKTWRHKDGLSSFRG